MQPSPIEATEAPHEEPQIVAKVSPNRKKKEPKELNNSMVIAVSVNPIEYVDDQAPPTPPPTYTSPTTPAVSERQPVVETKPQANAKSRAKIQIQTY